MPGFLRKANQFGELFILAGPADEEIEVLRRLGYRPEGQIRRPLRGAGSGAPRAGLSLRPARRGRA